MKHGLGKFIWKGDKVYEGMFYNDRIIGDGKMTWDNGRKYEG